MNWPRVRAAWNALVENKHAYVVETAPAAGIAVHHLVHATMAEAITHLAANPCEIGFVVGTCLSSENNPFLPDVTGGEPCWPCYARRVLQIVEGRQ